MTFLFILFCLISFTHHSNRIFIDLQLVYLLVNIYLSIQWHKERMHDPVLLDCTICSALCIYLSIQWHKERMHDPVLLDCTICSAKMNASALKDHMKHHANAGVCQECGAQVRNCFSRKYDFLSPNILSNFRTGSEPQ